MGNVCHTSDTGVCANDDKCSGGDNTNRANKESALMAATCDNTNEQVYSFTRAKIIKIYDGDTFWIAADHCGKLTKFSVRLFGVDCPELKTKNEKEKKYATVVKEYLTSKILGKIVDVEVLNNRIVNGKKIHEKYGRLIANIYVDGVSLSTDLINKGFAKAYDGGTKTKWDDRELTELLHVNN
jgi:micrococcal nuclease